MFYLNLKESKSGHPKMQNPIMLYFKAKGVHTAPPGNSYNFYRQLEYKKVSVGLKWEIKNYYLFLY